MGKKVKGRKREVEGYHAEIMHWRKGAPRQFSRAGVKRVVSARQLWMPDLKGQVVIWASVASLKISDRDPDSRL